jgi:hypothetical protein
MMMMMMMMMITIGIINWHHELLRKQHHPKADVDRLYVHRKQGERWLMQLEEAYMLEL